MGSLMPFVPPNRRERAAALGDKPPAWLEALGTDGHRPMYKPGVDDWNRGRNPTGQSYEVWRKTTTHNTKARNKIYLQPLGDFDPSVAPSLEHLQAFATAYFQVEVRVLPAIASHHPQFQRLKKRP